MQLLSLLLFFFYEKEKSWQFLGGICLFSFIPSICWLYQTYLSWELDSTILKNMKIWEEATLNQKSEEYFW